MTMTLKECYAAFGGDLDAFMLRLPSDRLIGRLLRKFPEDGSFRELCAAVPAGDRETAFRCAHSLKGLCLNLELPRLLKSSSALTEALRPGNEYCPETVDKLLAQVRQDYQTVCDAIGQLDT